jgi:hypothetical protein
LDLSIHLVHRRQVDVSSVNPDVEWTKGIALWYAYRFTSFHIIFMLDLHLKMVMWPNILWN